MLTATIFELYAAKCTLWVEDDLTRRLLTTFWMDNEIRVLNAGSGDGVAALVLGAPKNVQGKQVIGLVDNDFGMGDESDWQNPTKHVIRFPVHEAENLLLDFEVLAVHARTVSAFEIGTIAKQYAETMLWWMTCKDVLHNLQRDATAHFPPDPPLDLANQDDAVDYITSADYWKNHNEALRTWVPKYVKERIAEVSEEYRRDLGNGRWVKTFSGKEILRHIRTQIDNGNPKGSTAAENDANFATLLAKKLRLERFRESSPTATLLSRLRAALRHRAGLPR